MTNITKNYDDKAKLIHAFASKFPTSTQISDTASMFGITEREARNLIARGRVLAVQAMAEKVGKSA